MRLPLFRGDDGALPGTPAPRDEASRVGIAPYPSGWFGLAFSDEIAPGAMKRAQLAGREVVLFRTESGVAAVFEAHCPHLGAHFGHGGCVVGETLRCPMHDFRFDTEGACVAAGAGHTHTPSAKAGVVPVREIDGVILAWSHPTRATPSWEPPSLAGDLAGGPVRRHRLTIRSHVQELAENLFDAAHLTAVHGYQSPEMDGRPSTEGPVIRGRTRMRHITQLGRHFTREVNVDVRNTMHGLGIVCFDSVADPGGLAFRGVFTWNPIAPGLVDFRLSVWVRAVDAGLAAMPLFRSLPDRTQRDLMGRMLVFNMLRDIRQDQAVLEHKRHLARPGLSDGDAAIPVFRKWARQFYADAEG